jgi:hypothetical protein
MGQRRNVHNISEENFSESGHLEIQEGDVKLRHDGCHENRLKECEVGRDWLTINSTVRFWYQRYWRS